MIKCMRMNRLPDDLQFTFIKYHTLAGLRMKMFIEFGDDCDGLEEGQTYMVAKVPDDYNDDISFEDLASAGINIVAYCYEPKPAIVVAVGDGSAREWRNKNMTEDQIIKEIQPKEVKEIKEPLSPMIATKEDIERARKLDEEYYSKNNR